VAVLTSIPAPRGAAHRATPLADRCTAPLPPRATPLAAALAVAALAVGLVVAPARAADTRATIGDLTHRAGDAPRRLVGYGLVVGLDGTGDRSWGGLSSQNATVQSVVNLLRRFDLEVPSHHLRLRNVAAVLVTAEVSPFARTGGRFEVSVSALGDAMSLEGGVLWMTPLVASPDGPAEATAQGALLVARDADAKSVRRMPANSARIPDGGLLVVDPPPVAAEPRLLLRDPNRLTAARIAEAVNAFAGDGAAVVEDPGSIRLALDGDDAPLKLAALDTLTIEAAAPARVIIHGREGLVVAGGDVTIGAAVIHHQGITLEIGDTAAPSDYRGVVRLAAGVPVQDVASGLHAAGARARDISAIFEALRDAGALRAEVVVR
jgi:flagellar P-ring protein precursor FlgI